MMCVLNSQERCLDQFIELGTLFVLKFVRVWDLREWYRRVLLGMRLLSSATTRIGGLSS